MTDLSGHGRDRMPSGSEPARVIWLYALAAAVFFGIDYVWLTRVADAFYREHLGHLLRDDPVLWAAALFYLVYIAGIVAFALRPGLRTRSWKRTARLGAFLGLFAYATFDLTCLALFEGFPAIVVWVDLAWGTVLTGTVSVMSYGIARRLGWG